MSKPTDGADERFTAQEKQRILQTVATLSEAELGAYFRREGVTEQQLKRWQAQVLAALERPKRRRATDSERELRHELKQVKRELQRKEKALAEAAALLVLKKKAQAIWGADEDESTDERTD